MIVRTDAIVLRTMRYRETSRILRLYTERFGKVSVLVKGARDRRNGFGAALEPMSYVTAVMYKNENRDLQLLTQCDVITPMRSLAANMEKMSVGMAVIELVDAVSHAEEQNHGLFHTTVACLRGLESADRNHENVLLVFECRVADALGFHANFDTCCICGTILDEDSVGTAGGELQLSRGGVLCARCGARSLGNGSISLEAVKVLRHFQGIQDVDSVTRVTLPENLRHEVSDVLSRYLRHHVDGLGNLKSGRVFSAMMQNL
jgi:DNA repair protein RecO (recombination protein O)